MSGITGVDGLASGIQTTEIVDALIAAARTPTVIQEQRQELLSARLEAVQGFNTRMLSAQLDLTNLRSGTVFNSMTVDSSNIAVLSGSATSNAVQGTYNFEVTRLAQAHQLASQGQSSRAADLGAGTLTLQVGSGASVDLNFDASNSSLDDIAAAINAEDAGVSAYVVEQTGSDPYRLVVQSDETGESSEISLAGSMATALNGGGTFEELTEALDAEITMGGGSLMFSSANNEFNDIIPGVNLVASAVGSSTISVGRDVSGASSAITTFIESLNGAIDYLNANTQVDPGGENSGILLSETDLRRSLDRVIRDIFSVIPGLPQSLNNVASLGIGIDRETGRISIDQGQLSSRLASDPDGVAKIFNNSGSSDDTGIQFAAISAETDVTDPFTVVTTQAAEQATTIGANIAAGVTINSGNRSFAMDVNGNSYSMTLAEGTYTRDEFVTHLQSVLNDELELSDQVLVGLDSDNLTLSTQRYGGSARIEVTASSANGTLAFDTNEYTGQDVAGTINGLAATGTGQVLVGSEGSADGLTLIVTADSTIASASVTVSAGLGQRLGERFTTLTDIENGSIAQKENGLTASIASIGEQIAAVDERLAVRREGLLREFRTMETLIGSLQTQQGFLEGAILGWQNTARAASNNN